MGVKDESIVPVLSITLKRYSIAKLNSNRVTGQNV